MKLITFGALACLFVFACLGRAQETSVWEVGMQALPASAANPCSDAGGSSPRCGKTLHLNSMVLVNPTAAAITVILADSSTNCGGSGCTLFYASVGAFTTYSVDLHGERATLGVFWSGSATGVQVWLAGN